MSFEDVFVGGKLGLKPNGNLGAGILHRAQSCVMNQENPLLGLFKFPWNISIPYTRKDKECSSLEDPKLYLVLLRSILYTRVHSLGIHMRQDKEEIRKQQLALQFLITRREV